MTDKRDYVMTVEIERAQRPSNLMPWSISEQLLYATQRIQFTDKYGKNGVGTGFAFNFIDESGTSLTTLVTNRHVIQDAVSVRLCFHRMEYEGDCPVPRRPHLKYEMTALECEALVVNHPEEEVDLSVVLLDPLLAKIEQSDAPVFLISLTTEHIWDDEKLSGLSTYQPVVMPGHPIGLCDVANNLPILRAGSLAYPAAFDYEDKAHGVIDLACFPGSSGSPVLVAHERGDNPIKPNNNFWNSRLLVLLGVLWGGPVWEAGKINVEPISVTTGDGGGKNFLNLGYYVKAKDLLSMRNSVLKRQNELTESEIWGEPYTASLPLTYQEEI